MSTLKPIIKIVVLTLVVVGLIAAMFGLTIAQEIPTGTVKGCVLDQNGLPIPRARITLRMEGDYAAPTIRGTTDEQGHFVITDVPTSGKWTGYASARGYESANLNNYVGFGVSEGRTTIVHDVSMDPRPPSIYGGFPSVFMVGEKFKASINGYSGKEETTLKISVYRYDYAADMRSRWGSQRGGSRPEVLRKNLHDPIYEHTYNIRTDSEGYFSRELTLPVKDEGGYALRAQLETAEGFYTTLITDLALVTKRAPGKTLVYASSYTKKQPIAGVRLEFHGEDDKRRPVGTTDADGLFVMNEDSTKSIGVLGSIGQSCAFANTYFYSNDERAKCLIYTDRPVYRPGHTVMFKGILAKSLPGNLTPMAGKRVAIKIMDGDGNALKEFRVTTSRFGTFNGKIDLDPEAKPGYYSIHASFGGEQHERSFSVEEYRKPEFKASVTFTKPRFAGGDTVEANVDASYYFGGPVAGAKVTYTVYKSPSYFHYYPDDTSDAAFYEDIYSSSESDSEYSENYGGAEYGEVILEGEGITDAGGVLKIRIPTKRSERLESYSVSASVMDAGGRTIDASADVDVTPADFALGVNTDAYFYQPNSQVQARVYAVTYDRKPVPGVTATVSIYRMDDVNHDKKTLILKREIQLDESGQGSMAFTVQEQGRYRIEVTANDQAGRTAMESDTVYVASESYAGEGYQAPALELTVDKKIYKTGDTARVMIASPLKESYVLLTIEGRRLFRQQVVHLTSPTKIVEVPLPAEYSPNVYACACLVNGKEMATSEKPIPISPKGKFVNVRIQSDKSRYLPGEQATYTIVTTDENGRGVPAEVSLGVVDESIYAIRQDSTPDMRRFFHGPVQNSVTTSFSYSEYYYGGEDKFAGKVRKYFPDTAYWNPSIVTDRNGVASVSFKMPDNLTSWRATARAVTANMAVGSAKQNVTVTKNILVRLQVPRFFRQRDQLTLTSVVHNYTDRDQNIRVWLDVRGLTVSGELARTVNASPNGTAVVSWDARADSTGTANLTVYAQGQTDQDAMQLEIPVLAHGVPETMAVAGVTKISTGFVLDVPADIVKDAGKLDLGFSSSLASAGLGIVDAIEDYRMESPEGIMDVLLPNVVMYQAMEQLGRKSPVRLAKIRKLVKDDLKRVYQWQLPDGGWSWWESGSNDPWMTAYVVYGLVRAKQAGLPVNEDALKQGIDSTIRSLPSVYDLGKRATMVYVLVLAGKVKPEWVDPILADKELQNYSLSLMMLSLVEMGQVDRARGLVPKLIAGADQSAMYCSWPENFEWGFYSCNDYETTAYAIRALLAVDPRNPCIDKGIRWLLTKRKGDRWNMNYDTASVVYALADYLKIRRTEAPNYSARVFVNNKLVREFAMGPGSITDPEIKVKLTGADIQPGRNKVRIEKNGPGDLFYYASLTYYSSAEDVPAKSSKKISIRREYYRLRLVKDKDNSLVYKPFPLGDTATVGEMIRCRLVIESPKDFQYVVVEDMLPSGCEVVERHRPADDEGEDYMWDYWWGGQTIYDNRISFFLPEVYNGKRVIEYDYRPEIRGVFHVMPAVAQGSFEPDIYAYTSERRLTVR